MQIQAEKLSNSSQSEKPQQKRMAGKIMKHTFRQMATAVFLLAVLMSVLLAIASQTFKTHANLPENNVRISVLRGVPTETGIQQICCGPNATKFTAAKMSGLAIPQFSKPVWVQIDTSGKSGILELSSMVDAATLYFHDSLSGMTSSTSAGDSLLFSIRDIKVPKIAFPITQDKASQKLFMKIEQTTKTYIRFSLYDTAIFDNIVENRNWWRALLIGSIAIMIVYNIFISILTGQLVFFLNAASIVSLLFVDIYLTGFGAAYLWPARPELSNLILNIALGSTSAFGSLFFYRFLNFSETRRRGTRELLYVPVMAIALGLSAMVLPYRHVETGMLALLGLTVILMFRAILVGIYAGNRYAQILAWPALAIVFPGAALLIANKLFGFDVGNFSDHILEGVLLIEALLFSLALAYRIRLTEEDRDDARNALTLARDMATQNIVHAIDQDRRRVAADLHDTAGQGLLAISQNLDRIAQLPEIDSVVRKEITRVGNYSKEVVVDIRRISHELHPQIIDYLGLQAAIEQLFDNLSHGASIRVDCNIDISADQLNQIQEIQMYRACQELVSNIAKHSGAENVKARIVNDGANILMDIADDGIGYGGDTTARSPVMTLGLGILEQRVRILGGSWLTKVPPGGRGTRTVIVFPVKFPMANITTTHLAAPETTAPA